MANELIVRPKTEIATQAKEVDILTFYEVPGMLDQIVKKGKKELLNKLNCGAVIMDSLNKISDSEAFFVEIPKELHEMLKSGEAVFDNSGKNPGAFTPNIRIKGEAGIKGQATIVQKTDSQAVSQSLANLAMMAMVQSVLEKLDVIEAKVEEIKQGQENDRIASIVGAFKGFMDQYSTFKTEEEMRTVAGTTYEDMQKGLAQLHFQIDKDRKKLKNAPTNNWQAFWKSITHPLHNESERYQKCYEDYVYDIQLYNRLFLLSDIVLYLKGDENIAKNHAPMFNYCNQYLDKSFQDKMNYLMAGKTMAITNILEYNKKLKLAFEGVLVEGVSIECKKEDVKYLNLE